MYSLRADDRYIEEWADVRELVRLLDENATADQVIFIDREQYQLIFMNYFKTPALVAVLPYAPGENYSGTPEVISDDPLEQLGIYSYYAIDWTAQHYDETWLVASSSPFEADKLRPIERHLASRYYPVEEITVSNRARAIRFLTVNANQLGLNEYTDFVFEERLSLEGFNLPLGTEYTSGDVLPVTLSWIPLETLPDDYNVSVQVAALDGFPLAQQDGQPQWTFGKTSTWEVNERYLDNHGIQLPADIQPGEYRVQVVVYRWQDGQRLQHASGDVAPIATIQVK